MREPKGRIDWVYAKDGSRKARARFAGLYLGLHDTKALAQEAIDEAKRERAGEDPDTCRTYAGEWFKFREESGQVQDIRDQRSDWRSRVDIDAAKWLDMTPRHVRPVHLQTWLKVLAKQTAQDAIRRKQDGVWVTELIDTGRPLSHESISKAVSLVKLFFDWLLSEGKMGKTETNPARSLLMPVRKRAKRKGSQRIVHLVAKEIKALFALELPLKVRAVFAVAIYAGLRRGEIWGLRWEFVDLKARKLYIRNSYRRDVKTATSVRDVPILPFLHEALRAYWSSLSPRPLRGLVFPAASGGCHGGTYDCGWSDKRARTAWTDDQGVRHQGKAGRKVKVTPGSRSKAGVRPEVTFLCLRHTTACQLLQGTVLGNAERLDLEDICTWLGHSDIGVTQRHYAEFAPGNVHDKALGLSRNRDGKVEKQSGKLK
jgi:integrase